jgi:hypothetical protein
VGVASADGWRVAVLGLGVGSSIVDGGCCSIVLEVVVPSKCFACCAGGSLVVRGGLRCVGGVVLRRRSACCRFSLVTMEVCAASVNWCDVPMSVLCR